MRRLVMSLAAAAAIALPPLAALARTPVPVLNWMNQPVATGTGTKVSIEQVAQAVRQAAASKGWAAVKLTDDQYSATRVVRGKHTVVVTISISPEQYSVAYQSSDNMKYRVSHGVAVIHPNYNVWARELVDAIRIELAQL